MEQMMKKATDRRNNGFEPILVEDLPTLDFLENDIRSRLLQIKNNKREILKKLFFIYVNQEYYFDELPEYQKNFALYIEERIEQNHRTSLDDAKIIALLATHDAEQILTLEVGDLVYLLKRIAQISDQKNPDRALEIQKNLLEHIQELNRNSLQNSIIDFNATKPIPFKVHKRIFGVKTKIDRNKKRIVMISEDMGIINKTNQLISLLSSENIDNILKYANEISNEMDLT